MLLLRHAMAPGGGDPPGFRLDDCATQRNLSAEGREQARRIGRQLAAFAVRTVWTSPWCRCRETAERAFPGRHRDEPAFGSFFQAPEREVQQTRQALALLRAWRGAGPLVVVTHQVNISALLGVVPGQGTGEWVRLGPDGRLERVMAFTPDAAGS
jgi:broad specificity phosphatase PhoE